jgi:hypothetical protein
LKWRNVVTVHTDAGPPPRLSTSEIWRTIAGALTIVISVAACGGAKAADAGPTAADATPSTTEVGDPGVIADITDPNAVMEQCLLERGLVPDRAGDVDGVAGAGLDLSSLDQTDPAVVEAIDQCSSEAESAATNGDAGLLLDEEEAKAGLLVYMEALYSCMEESGFHPYSVDDPDVEFSGAGGIVTNYPDGETSRDDFPEATTECEASASDATRSSLEAGGGS